MKGAFKTIHLFTFSENVDQTCDTQTKSVGLILCIAATKAKTFDYFPEDK